MTKRMCTVSVTVLLGISMSAPGQTALPRSGALRTSGSDRVARAATARAPSYAAMQLLRKPVENIDWLDTPFEEVVDWLKAEGEDRVNVVPRWGQLSVESVDRDTLVTLQLNNTTVAEVLNEALENVSPDGEVRYQGIAHRLTISTRADFDRKMHVRIYPVADIMFHVPDFGRTAPNIDLQQTTSGGQGGSGQSVFQGGAGSGQGGGEQSGQQAQQRLQERLGELRQLIEEVIAPDSWDTANTGGLGRIRIINRSLVVFNTIEVHEMIAGRFSFGD